MWVFIAPVLILGAIVLLKLLIRSLESRGPRRAYYSKKTLLTPTELSFYAQLYSALPAEVVICPQVRLWDVIDCERGDTAGQNKIRSKHLDFVLIESGTARILAAIELDDRSHDRPFRAKSDELKDAALACAGVPLIRYRVARSYDFTSLLAMTLPASRPPIRREDPRPRFAV